jgi:hypothetical protein
MSQKPSYIYVVFTEDGYNTVIGAFSTEARAHAYIDSVNDEDLYMEALMIDELPKIESVVYKMGA